MVSFLEAVSKEKINTKGIVYRPANCLTVQDRDRQLESRQMSSRQECLSDFNTATQFNILCSGHKTETRLCYPTKNFNSRACEVAQEIMALATKPGCYGLSKNAAGPRVVAVGSQS